MPRRAVTLDDVLSYFRAMVEARFWRLVEKGEGCWMWKGAVDTWGYGFMQFGSPAVDKSRRLYPKAHRLAWEFANGPIPPDMVVMHTCDTPTCVRPDHLRLGTHQENADDKMAKGRWKGRPYALSEEQVRIIRERYQRLPGKSVAHKNSGVELAKEFGVSTGSIYALLSGRTKR